LFQTLAGLRSLGLPAQVIIGAFLGIAAGVVLGERTAALSPVGTAYTMMLEIAIYPYLVCSLLLGLGRLAPGRSGRLLRASWPVYLFVWAITLATIWLLRQAIPPAPAPVVLQPESADAQTSLLALLIPANPFASLLRNDVPAIVVFAVIYGIAVQGVAQRQTLFDVLETVRLASLTIWNWIVKLAPYGVFALLAVTAGTLRPDQLGGFVLYNTLFLAGTVVLAFVVLPLALTALAPTSYRALLRELRPGLVLSLVTTLPVVSLPFIQRAAAVIAKGAGCPDGEETDDVIKASVSLSYVLAQVGNHFCLLLLFYAAYRASHSITLGQQALLPLLTVLSCVGTPSTTIGAVSFFASWLHLPTDTTELWIETSAVTRYGQVLLSVSAFGFIASAVPLIYWRKWRVRLPRAAAAIGGGFGLFAAVVLLAIALRPILFPPDQRDLLMTRTLDPGLTSGLEVQIEQSAVATPASGGPPTVPAIQRAGVLWVGYNPNVVPFSYRNADGALVGYDISFAYRLAHDLSVKLTLVPFTWDRLADDLAAGRFDLGMSGIYLTDTRLAGLIPGPAYWSSPIALLVPAATAMAYTNRAALLARQGLRLAVFESAVMSELAHRLFPAATIVTVPDYGSLPELGDKVDGALWTLVQARAWAQAHPGWTAVVPTGAGGPLSIAAMLPPGAEALRAYIAEWTEWQRTNGFAAAQAAYWMEGKPRTPQRPRWNLLDALTGGG
jgi:Na+/H+-dicarboxylate symporter/ABC-type amino acid transport substrate-binding protein